MSIDLSQFTQAFLDESFEGLERMEAELLREAVLDREQVNAIFRAAHSIKGSAGTFGFTEVSRFTHVVETLLDEVRDGHRDLTSCLRGELLEAVDCLRQMLTAARDASPHDVDAEFRVRARLEALLDGSAQPAGGDRGGADVSGWEIEFAPHPSLLRSGNDPLRILAWLRELGELEVACHHEAVPALQALCAEDCQLSWTLRLHGQIEEARIREAFEWVEDECRLTVRPLDTHPVASPGTSDVAAARPPEPEGRAVERRADAASIRVATAKVDALVNMVGELVINQAMLHTLGHSAETLDARTVAELRRGLALLERNTRELQDAVLSVRMLPIRFVFSRFTRLVRDLSASLGKQVKLQILGEETELDKGLIEKLVDPLTHIVRNAIDHGIESPERRSRTGKPAQGSLTLKAAHQGGNVVIEVQDDGAGLDRERILAKARSLGLDLPEQPSDREVWQLILAPGFSTAETVTDLSGRGVGMDVVLRNLEAINGRLEIDSTRGVGTRMTIRLPLTLAILDGMSVRVGEEVYILPLTTILESLRPSPGQLHTIAGRGQVVRLRDDYIPLVPLHEVFDIPAPNPRPEDGIVVVVETAQERAALVVDELLAQHQVVIKSLEKNYRKVPGVSGATILGDGRVAMIVDVDSLARLH